MSGSGTATLDFTALAGNPSSNYAEVAVTGQSGILSTSQVEAWLRLQATSDHTLGDLIYDPVLISAGNIVVATGFTIYGKMPYGRAYGTYSVDWVWV